MQIRSLHSRCGKEKFEFARTLRENPTPAETMLWGALRAKQVKGVKFRRQQVLFGWIADFWCSPLQMVIEVDGGSHIRRERADMRRDQALASQGILTLRFTNQCVLHSLPVVLASLEIAIEARSAEISTLQPTGIRAKHLTREYEVRRLADHGRSQERWVLKGPRKVVEPISALKAEWW